VTHGLRERHPHSAIGQDPLIVSLRYRCECNVNEVLQISAVIDMNSDEERFLWTMRQLWRDVQFEAQQHVTKPQKPVAYLRDVPIYADEPRK